MKEIAICLAACALAAAAGCRTAGMAIAPGVRIERVFGPEDPGRYKHPASIAELENGDLYLVYNDSMSERTPLSVAISADGDGSYPRRKDIVTGTGDYAYPSAIQTRDGKIHVVFPTDERTVIRHAVFEEDAI